jgi:flagellin
MLAIKNNIMSENAQRAVATNYDALAKSVQRLSSGQRINSASDDAAGMAVRELMRSDIAVLRQGSRNAQDAISMLQTGEAALQVTDNLLVRMKELAEQAATGSYTSKQKEMMQSEFDQMRQEITRISESTNFNGTQLLAGGDDLTIQVGTGNIAATDQITIALADMSSDGLALGTFDISSIVPATGAGKALEALQTAIETKDTARAGFGATINRLQSTIQVLNVQAENLMAAESRISDVDVASEMSALTRNQVMAQAGVAMLAQANSMPQLALKLLNG